MSVFTKFFKSIIREEDWAEIKSSSFRDILNGNIFKKRFFTRQLGLIAMIVVLLIIYIGNRYSYEKQLVYQNKLKKEIQDKKYESLTISAQLMQISRQSNVLKMLNEKGIDLHELNEPLIILNDSVN
ncbi:MAG TPA: FtsL-like putative cell division protein [Paludibacteraceae bacterium]|nr:hypothetical protein [Paludibacteraceae bacterium]HOK36579.1 FtsL-like putative cell division protein [Paludibacteraceae bacterium]HOL00552.1 FtsL-like putative cell division protein [Paludibacteraceae bacterium]HPC26472.1 FtsL-like putative cell division protein [Paludibacteraceae bacterium]HPO67815.1 FtsL-like putative cell division protein [Paludibacteraceae bacterium]